MMDWARTTAKTHQQTWTESQGPGSPESQGPGSPESPTWLTRHGSLKKAEIWNTKEETKSLDAENTTQR